jgi:hypothetical protein
MRPNENALVALRFTSSVRACTPSRMPSPTNKARMRPFRRHHYFPHLGDDKRNGWYLPYTIFGTREQMQGQYLRRAAAAMYSIYGNSCGRDHDADGQEAVVPVDGMSAEDPYNEQYAAWHLYKGSVSRFGSDANGSGFVLDEVHGHTPACCSLISHTLGCRAADVMCGGGHWACCRIEEPNAPGRDLRTVAYQRRADASRGRLASEDVLWRLTPPSSDVPRRTAGIGSALNWL